MYTKYNSIVSSLFVNNLYGSLEFLGLVEVIRNQHRITVDDQDSYAIPWRFSVAE